jgi:glycosyltransferase involved in cell wall biosynthesis
MAYHIVLNRPTDLNAISAAAAQGATPRHSMAVLAQELGASVHDGADVKPDFLDRLLGKVTGIAPNRWAIARKLRRELRAGDVIFCTGEDVGTPVAFLCGRSPDIHVTMMVHYITRLKGRAALQLFGLKQSVSLFFSVSQHQASSVTRYLGLPQGRAISILDQTDTSFFSPASAESKARPVIVSVGLEQRDYNTLATATADLPVDVKISGHSADTKQSRRAFPKSLPENMSRKFYPWPDLLKLYREADVVVVSLFANTYAAGVQAMMEALACGKPVILAETEGLKEYYQNGCVIGVAPSNAAELRKAIMHVLDDEAFRREVGRKSAETARRLYALETYTDNIARELRKLHDS